MAGDASSSLLLERPHRRLNALTGEWVFVSPQRTERPWGGRQEVRQATERPAYDPWCYLCPGNARAKGEINPAYTSTFVFTNDFPAFVPDGSSTDGGQAALLRANTHLGTCSVICYSPRHDLTLAELAREQLLDVIDTWSVQEAELSKRWRWVQIFENKGEMMGCSNPHPHGQVWAGDFIPNEVAKELASQRRWFKSNRTPLLLDYVKLELSSGARVVVENPHWLAIVPWWAVWPFETLVLPRRHVRRLCELSRAERGALAALLHQLLSAYDAMFDVSFPYSFGWHGSPGGDADKQQEPDLLEGCQLHAHFYPPLLRSASVKKFMVGYEMLAEAQRDIAPEQAAERLRSKP
jgi:UDPglucose--hexose-1-phosphate uridylyltransferase